MAPEATDGGVQYDRAKLDLAERRFWREIWDSVPDNVAAEHAIEVRQFGPVQVSTVGSLASVGMMNLVLGATQPGVVGAGHLAAATEWMDSRGADGYVPVTPDLPETDTAAAWLAENGFSPGYAWMKFVRDPHPPRFTAPKGIEVLELTDPAHEPFGMIAATGFGLPAWGSAFFANLPGRDGWRCYVGRIEGEAQACAAMHVHDGVAEFGIAATLEPARGHGCQLALLRQRIIDANAAGCHTLFVETGQRVPNRPSASYRNILKAGFKEAYLRPNWQRAAS